MNDELLKNAISLYKAGDKTSARDLLKKLLKDDPKNENAWLWLSACMSSDEQKKYCLQKVLEINPENKTAQSALLKLEKQYSPSIENILATTEPNNKKPTTPSTVSPSIGKSKQKKPRNRAISCLAFLGLLVVIFICISSMLVNNSDPSQISSQEPTTNQRLVVQSGSLSQYQTRIQKDTIVAVYKKNGTLDAREGDLKELCLDWLYYRAKIAEYVASGEDKKAAEARKTFNNINLWLNEYDENDVQWMFSIIEENQWSLW